MKVTVKYPGAHGESALELEPGRALVIGRDQSCDVVIPHAEVSRRHLRLSAGSAAVLVEDLQSSNGTFHEQRRLQREQLAASAALRLGETGPEILIEIELPATDQAGPFQAQPAGSKAAVGRRPIDTTSKYSREQLGAQLERGREESRGSPADPPLAPAQRQAEPQGAAAAPSAAPSDRPPPSDVSSTRLYLNEDAAQPPSRPDQTRLYGTESGILAAQHPEPPPSPGPATEWLDPSRLPSPSKAPSSTRLVSPEKLGVRPGLKPLPEPSRAATRQPPSQRAPEAPAKSAAQRSAPGELMALRRQMERLRTLLFVIGGIGLILGIAMGAATYRLQVRAQSALTRINRMDSQLSELLRWLNDQKAQARGEISGALQASKEEFQRQFDLELQNTRAEFEQRVQGMRREFEQARANIERDLGGVKSLRQTAQAEAQAGSAARASAQEASASVVLIYTSYVLANGDEVPQWQTASGFYLGNRTKLVTTKMAVQPWKFLDPDMLASMQTGGYKIQEARTVIAVLRSGTTLAKASGGDELDPAQLALSSQRGKVRLAYVPRDDWSSATGEATDGQKVAVQMHRVDSPSNFAVLEVSGDATGPPVQVRTTSLVGALGAKFTVLGYPAGITGARAEAAPDVVSLRQRDKAFDLDKTIAQPQLGSPVLDPNGRVVAMAVSGRYCIPIEQIVPYVSR